jgi:diacylglycerol kinase family enzyme
MVVVAAGMTLTDRIKARRRLPTGGHVPHPAIEQSRRPAFQIEFDRPTGVWLDGERIATATNLSVRVEPDELTCVV